MKAMTRAALGMAALALVLAAGSCSSVGRSKLSSFEGLAAGQAAVAVGLAEVVVQKDARQELVADEVERLAASLLLERGYQPEPGGREASLILSIFVSEHEFVKGLYRIRSVLIEAALLESGTGRVAHSVRLAQETDNSVDSSLYLGEVLGDVLNKLLDGYEDGVKRDS